MVEGGSSKLLETRGIEFKTLSHNPARTIMEASRELGFSPQFLAKTLICEYEREKYATAVLRGSDELDWKKLARVLRTQRDKINLLDKERLVETTGNSLGALLPFGYGDKFIVIFDRALTQRKVVVCSTGSETESVLIRSNDLIAINRGRIADIARDMK